MFVYLCMELLCILCALHFVMPLAYLLILLPTHRLAQSVVYVEMVFAE